MFDIMLVPDMLDSNGKDVYGGGRSHGTLVHDIDHLFEDYRTDVTNDTIREVDTQHLDNDLKRVVGEIIQAAREAGDDATIQYITQKLDHIFRN